MRSKLANFIISFLFVLILSIFILLGIILWDNYMKIETSTEPKMVETVISENKNTIDKDIKTPEIVENPFEEIKDREEEEIDDIDYSNVSINKHFYNQLDDYSKNIYKAFETNKENMKKGNYRIELGNSFSSLLSEEDGQEKLGQYYQSAIEAYTYDNPDVFYLSPNKMYLNVETITKGRNVTYNVFINCGKEENYFINEFSSEEQINNAISQIEEVRDEILQNRTNNTYKNIKMVHDYLINNLQYDTSISKSNIYNIYGAMVNNECVCEGYARSFKYLMDCLRNTMYISYWKGN